LLNRQVLGWCAFDFANSSYTTLITTVAFSVYFREAIVGARVAHGDLYWGMAGIAVNLALIVASPVMGALADFSGRKKAWLFWTVAQTVAATAALAVLQPGQVALAVVLYVIASVGFEGGYVFYNAFLPEVSTPETSGKISGLAWGVGFVGGLTALIACAPFIGRPLTTATGLLDPAAAAGYRVSFVIVAAFFAAFSIPTFVFLRENPGQHLEHWRDYAIVGFRRVGHTLRHLGLYRETAKYVLAYIFFFGGINVVIRFSAIYASRTFAIRGLELVALFVITNIVAVPGTLMAGWLADRAGQRLTIILTLVLWVCVVLVGAFAVSRWMFWMMAAGAAIGMGSTQAVGRSYMALLTPRERESEFFGFYVLAGQVGSIIAFLVFSLVSSGTGDQRLAVLWTTPFFVIGLLLVLSINERRALEGAAAPGVQEP
jgi:UMF1 family MFS transporter